MTQKSGLKGFPQKTRKNTEGEELVSQMTQKNTDEEKGFQNIAENISNRISLRLNSS
jgi:hypothetical protein